MSFLSVFFGRPVDRSEVRIIAAEDELPGFIELAGDAIVQVPHVQTVKESTVRMRCLRRQSCTHSG